MNDRIYDTTQAALRSYCMEVNNLSQILHSAHTDKSGGYSSTLESVGWSNHTKGADSARIGLEKKLQGKDLEIFKLFRKHDIAIRNFLEGK